MTTKPTASSTEPRSFRLGAILSITHHRLLAREGLGEVYKLAGHLVGRDVMSHELGLVCLEAGPQLLAQFPDLKKIDTRTVNKNNWKGWLRAREKKFGDAFIIEPLKDSKIGGMGVIETLAQVSGLPVEQVAKEVIFVEPGSEDTEPTPPEAA